MHRLIENPLNSSNKSVKQKKSFEYSELLIVEDNLMVQFSLDHMLNQLGRTADFADSGKKALNLYHSNYQLILLDIDLPDINGLEVAKTIRAIEKENGFPNVPIIAMTSHHDEPEYQEKCLSAGMNGFSNKPTFAQLEIMLHRYLSVENSH